jgi:eukaryotic-like serine/threonine-protein kinase
MIGARECVSWSTPLVGDGVEERCRTLAGAATLMSPSAVGETIRAAEIPSVGGAIDEPPASLPGISIVGASDHNLSGMRWPTTDKPDLEIRGTIAEGGMGRVLAAHQRSLRREVALKTLRPDTASEATTLALLREGVVTGALEHPNIVPVHALGCDANGHPLLVMKRIEGVSWGTLLREPDHAAWLKIESFDGRRLDAHLEILKSICNALHFAHQRRIVHRDLKPDNVMVGAFGEVYLVDWGIATRSGTIAASFEGTPSFAAPEMVLEEPVDARTDVYLLGATLHYVLTGQPRHRGTSIFEVLMNASYSQAQTCDDTVPRELAELCNRATARDPTLRPESAMAFRRELTEYTRHRGAIALVQIASRRLDEARERTDQRQRVLTEAHFGFRQAMQQWPESEDARRGLTACLREMIASEIEQQDVAGARALLAELPAMDRELEDGVAALERSLAEKAAHDERLRALERDLNPEVNRRAREAIVTLAAVAYLALAVYVSRHKGTLGPRDALRFGTMVLIIALAVVAVARKRLFTTAYNRRLIALALTATFGVFISRVVGVILDVPVPTTLAHDLLMLAAVSTIATLFFGRWMMLPAAMFVLGSLATAVFPDRAPVIFAGAVSIISVGFVVVFRVWKRRADVR